MKTTIKFAHRVINPDEVAYVDAVADVVAPPVLELERPGVDAVIVIDPSESMKGPPLDSAKTAVRDMIRQLPSSDRLGIVAFDSQVTTVLPLAYHDPTMALSRVREIKPGGTTNLSGGWAVSVPRCRQILGSLSSSDRTLLGDTHLIGAPAETLVTRHGVEGAARGLRRARARRRARQQLEHFGFGGAS